ncbi:MAG: hypothetical protein A2846_02070 [Candidatus Doudnabacteria bacterium RIFCSPHIGHO2_01_FULL_49_9]|uniref:Uncharacterized protein n=1 Tax=Candidatus Doudnabacteria bacterium RIFCSPHIGHO2_01_FULL_49_9 TaxID=1817827 RepID=A0A1F5P340_9BACT|nr:MAG: hypothetical protein A2846_02070 [Candidatus Doudnabacteria bacterium RIFCSPHIGHO2_01_FULL_49_9]
MPPEDQQKTLDRLTRSIELAYSSPNRLFWRGLLWGLGRGIGTTLGLALAVIAGYYFLRASGLGETYQAAIGNLQELTRSINSLRQ